ncbi:hypothetical protein GGS26DRAFT_77863 [Hypomontagnella submonticulosa]|nr:hypothetical protein GGS26DRAFT_77863 [Hypomontagnella submonticulosa]
MKNFCHLTSMSLMCCFDEFQREKCRSLNRGGVSVGIRARRLEGSNTWGIHAPIAWATLISSDYIRLLEMQRPEALVVSAHFAAYFHQYRGFWAFGDAGEYLIRAIHKVVGSFWEDSMSVPLQALQTHSSIVRPIPDTWL